MSNLIIEETKYTPYISFNGNDGNFDIRGKSYPENTFEFYKPMMEWVENYFEQDHAHKISVNFEIIYFNSSSSKLFFDFFDLLEELYKAGKNIEINWIYDEENESALEAGEDFQDDFDDLKINLLKKQVV